MIKKISLSLGITLILILAMDGLLRMSSMGMFYFNTNAAYHLRRYPDLPKCYRYVAQVDHRAKVVGDLAWVSGNHERLKEVRFVSDDLGFRNTQKFTSYDHLILGDSFGVSTLTDQPQILSEQMNSLGVKTYNMSIDAANLWKEAVTFAYEIDRVPLKKDGVVNWLIFEGNDLEGPFYDDLDPEVIKNSFIKSLGVHAQNYYKNSVVRNIVKAVIAQMKAPKPSTGGSLSSTVITKEYFGAPMLFNTSYAESIDLDLQSLEKFSQMSKIEDIISFVSERCRAKGFKLRIVIVPTKARVYEWLLKGQSEWTSSTLPSGFSQWFRSQADIHKLGFIDLGPVLIEASNNNKDDKAPMFWLDDTHWSDVAQNVVARCLIDIQ